MVAAHANQNIQGNAGVYRILTCRTSLPPVEMGAFSQLLWLILIVAYVFRDRILGVGLAKWLSKLTGFRWSLDWLSLTLGL